MKEVYEKELELQIFEKEGIRVVFRSKGVLFVEYPYIKKAVASMTVANWLQTRLKPIIGECEVEIIDGYGKRPHGGTKIENVRNSYEKKCK